MQARCPACGEVSLFVREPVYDGFTKTGEVCKCTSCGAEHAPAALTPGGGTTVPDVFADVERPAEVRIEGQGEQPPFCRYCSHYVVNPFTQRCGISLQEVDATDTCESFERAETPEGL